MRGVDIASHIHDSDGLRAAFEIADPDFHFALAVGAMSLLPQRVLVDCNDVAIGENGFNFGLHVGEVVAGEERRGEHGPHGEVSPILGEG